ncbi:MAG: hypothetical protein UT33_C0011G0189 [Candidatus Peregrinibacteria bacterium GW2011_GWC2_39_14]|nr:MAG: hypothetical protein UT33_C0011G0189 [Candidatus Peregrinibacteria bacterium GW2011_GWC2_39_14]
MKKCKQCEIDFEIRDQDIVFYDKISPIFDGQKCLIPEPKLCPKCREQRRLAYRNERTLYKRKSSLSNKDIISVFSPDSKYKIYTSEEWWSDFWDPLAMGRDFDFSRGFFDQFYELELEVPRPPLINNKAENSDFCNFADGNKNSYLVTSANWNQDCYYGFLMVKCRNSADCIWCTDCELVYECLDCINCYNLKYSQYCENCSESAFLYNCKGLTNCMFCINLNNKKYCIFNKEHTKEDYEKAVKYMHGSYAKYQEMIQKFADFKRAFPIRKANNFIGCQDCVGDNIFHSKNVYMGFDIYNSKDSAYLHDGLKGSDCYDVCFFDGVELCYESTSLIGYGYRFTNFCRDSYNLFYCDNCHSCKNCFGCVGLRRKEFCVFNKQYSEPEYNALVVRIIKKMEETGEFGEFFPAKYSPFAYNETLAHDYYPLKKDQAVVQGFRYVEPKKSDYMPQKVVLLDNINEVSDSICNELLACSVTGKNYKIIPQELSFYKKLGLPLPRKCFDQRNFERVALRNSHMLYDRKCDKCGALVKTTYARNRPPKIYCEKCYLGTV